MIHIIKSIYPPSDTNHIWVDLSDGNKIKIFRSNTGWTAISITEDLLERLNKKLDLILLNGTTDVIDSIEELLLFLEGITNKDTLVGLLTSIREQILDSLNSHISDMSNPHNVSKEQLGLDNVDNTSDMNKPMSNATKQAINDILDIVHELHGSLQDKVDKVEGKGLSTEDFTTALKQKLEGLTNYNDAEINAKIDALKNSLDALVGSDDVTSVIDTFLEIEDFLQGITNTETLVGLLQELRTNVLNEVKTNIDSKTSDLFISYSYGTLVEDEPNDVVLKDQDGNVHEPAELYALLEKYYNREIANLTLKHDSTTGYIFRNPIMYKGSTAYQILFSSLYTNNGVIEGQLHYTIAVYSDRFEMLYKRVNYING